MSESVPSVPTRSATIRPVEAWAIRKALVGRHLNGETDALAEPFLGLAALLSGLPATARTAALGGFLCGRSDRDAIRAAVEEADPDGPEPGDEGGGEEEERFATVADIRRGRAESRWTWEGWIPHSGVFGLAGGEGTGKTRTAMDLHRRVWNGMEAPDGQAFSVEPGRPAVWICADGHQDELTDMLPAFGLPDESVVFAATPDEPYEGVDMDAPGLIEPGGMLERVVASKKPWCVFVDTLTYATARNLCDQNVMKGLKSPLVRLAQTYGVNIGLLLHVSREGQALGRRIKGVTRTLIHLECPDPSHSERLKMWVEKSHGKKPPALGVVLGSDGNTYDSTPPAPAEGNPVGRPSEARDKARKFIVEALTKLNDQEFAPLCRKWEAAKGATNTFFRAREDMEKDGQLTCEGRPLVMHLVGTDFDDTPY
jgi:hypothetical protein